MGDPWCGRPTSYVRRRTTVHLHYPSHLFPSYLVSLYFAFSSHPFPLPPPDQLQITLVPQEGPIALPSKPSWWAQSQPHLRLHFLALEIDLSGIHVVKLFSCMQMMKEWSKMQLILISHQKLLQITQ